MSAIALDVGGTFTDVALLDTRSGRLTITKTPSTPADPSQGFLAGVAKALALAAASPGDLDQVLHGTTIATNAILEGKGAATGLLTTAGFRYVLEIGRHDIPRHANMFAWQKPPRPVPPELIFEIPERLAIDGEELEPVDDGAARAAARRLREAGVDSVAICFLHSYANPAHERRAREILLAAHPACAVSLSSEVLPVFREYERSMATALNAYVLPLVGRYVGRLEGELRTAGVRAALRIMKSNGGVIGAEVARHQPIHTALSGPAAGVVGARLVGATAGFTDLISVDVGGTSADVCLIRDGEAEVTSEGRVGAWPLHVPMLDVHTIGAGGGSIARVAEDGTLTVGPQSAGAVPGPVCYGAGGEEPTVTDAHLVLGRIPPVLGGGEIHLDAEAARRAIVETIARPLGLPLEAAAAGILDILNHHMVGAIRLVSVERGHDPRAFALVPFGGAGPLHGGALADLLGMRTIVVPPSPGVLSALGLLATEVRNDYARTSFHKLPECDRAAVAAIYADLEGQASAWLDAEGVPSRERRLLRLAVYNIYFLRGVDPLSGEFFLCSDGIAVGYGARPFADGLDAIYYVAQKNYPAEFLEMVFPMRLRQYALHQDSGGPGLWRGGCGVVREVELLADEAVVALRQDNVLFPSAGVNGGHAGRPGRAVVNPGCPDERPLAAMSDGNVLRRGDVLRLHTSGGGGWGNPLDRPLERVRRDVLGGVVSTKSARADYGVVIDAGTGVVNAAASERLRAEMRGPVRMFHRGDYFGPLIRA